MRLLDKSKLTTINKQKGKTRFCCKSKSSSSSSCSSSSSSCSSSSSDGSFSCLKADNGKIYNLSGTTVTYTNGYFTNLNVTNDTTNNVPNTITTATYSVPIPSRYTDLSQVYLINTATTNITFSKFNSAFNGVRLLFVNISGGSTNITITFSGGDTVNALTSFNNAALANYSAIEVVGNWNSSTGNMQFYKLTYA